MFGASIHQGVHFKAPDAVPNVLGHCSLNVEELNLPGPKVVKEKAGFRNHFLSLLFLLTILKILLKADNHVKFKNIKNFLFSHYDSLHFQNAILCVFKFPSWVLYYVWTSG